MYMCDLDNSDASSNRKSSHLDVYHKHNRLFFDATHHYMLAYITMFQKLIDATHQYMLGYSTSLKLIERVKATKTNWM